MVTVQNDGVLRSLRARSAERHYNKNKTRSVIHEDRELQRTPEAEVLLELVEKGSSWRIVIPEILLGTVS